MPITQQNGNYNIGNDTSVLLQDILGNSLQISNVTDFSAKQMVAGVTVDRLDGVQMFADLPKGWSFSIGFDRGDNAVDLFFAAREAAWLLTGAYAPCYLYQYINEGNGGQTIFLYDNVAVTLSDAGSWKGDATVKMKIDGKANSRTLV